VSDSGGQRTSDKIQEYPQAVQETWCRHLLLARASGSFYSCRKVKWEQICHTLIMKYQMKGL
ncbi:CCDC7 isoform 3, partial [Pongo abelii]